MEVILVRAVEVPSCQRNKKQANTNKHRSDRSIRLTNDFTWWFHSPKFGPDSHMWECQQKLVNIKVEMSDFSERLKFNRRGQEEYPIELRHQVVSLLSVIVLKLYRSLTFCHLAEQNDKM